MENIERVHEVPMPMALPEIPLQDFEDFFNEIETRNEVKVDILHEEILQPRCESTEKDMESVPLIVLSEYEEPLPQPEPYQSSSKFEDFLSNLRKRVKSPKKDLKKTVSSKVFSHFHTEIIDKYQTLSQTTTKIGAKQISQIKYYKNLPKVAEEIALCYLYLFEITPPKSHYWEKFVIFLAQPGIVIQKLRNLPIVLENEQLDSGVFWKISEVFGKIPKNEQKVSDFYYELQILIEIIKEVLKLVEIVPEPQKKPLVAHIPKSRKTNSSEIPDISSIVPSEILKKTDNHLIKAVLLQEKKGLIELKSQAQRLQWDEKRFLKSEFKSEEKREQGRELEIQKNTVFPI